MCLKNLEIITLKNYELCSSHYLGAPGSSWDAMLKMTKNELELIPDPDMYIFFEKSTRGRISYICNRYSKVNKKYLKSYDPKKEPKHIKKIHSVLEYSQSQWLKPYIEFHTIMTKMEKRCIN